MSITTVLPSIDERVHIAGHICAALYASSKDQCHEIDYMACEAFLSSLSLGNSVITVPEGADIYARLIACFSNSLFKNNPLKRISNIVLVTDEIIHRVESARALDTILPVLLQLGYVEKLPKYAIRYTDDQYYCRQRFTKITRLENNDSLNGKALMSKIRDYPNRFLLAGCSLALATKICVRGCPYHCRDAANCWYRDFKNGLKKGDYTIQIYPSKLYIRDILRCQAGKYRELPIHNTVIFLDRWDSLVPVIQSVAEQKLRTTTFYSFLLQCERLCGTKKVHKAGVRAFTQKLRQGFDTLLLNVGCGMSTDDTDRLLLELRSGMDILAQKCRILFCNNHKMEAQRRELCRLLDVFLSAEVELQLDVHEDLVGIPILGDAGAYLLQCLDKIGIQTIISGNEK